MGRSRAVSHAAADTQNQRGKRKRTASGAENAENSSTAQKSLAQESNEPKGAFYHCNYCNKDISGKIRIKCVVCPDFDVCIECFSVGAEVSPHKCNHPYRVMDNLSFPLICPDWNADEEMLLLEGIEMYGFGNWTEVSEHVGTRRRQQCIDHYNATYMNSPCFPVPDMSHVMGKSRDELLALAKRSAEVKKEEPMLVEITLKEVPSFSPGINFEESKKNPACKSSAHSTAGLVAGATKKKASNKAQIKDETKVFKVAESQSDRSIGEKKLRTLGEEGPSMTELSGYNLKREEFEIEYDNDAEQILADMEFKDTDTDADRELKIRVLHVYSQRLDERKRRKKFILERNLLYPDPFEKNLAPEEREIYQRFKVFMRFHSTEEHKEFIKSIIEEQQIVKRILDLQEARSAGCRTDAEATRYLEEKRKKENEENALRIKESSQAGVSSKMSQISPRGSFKGSKAFHPDTKETFLTTQAISSSLDYWDTTGLVGSDLLSETEKRLCSEIRVLPSHYLKMLQTMSTEILSGKVKNKSDAHSLFKVEPSKVDRVYDMLLQKGISPA